MRSALWPAWGRPTSRSGLRLPSPVGIPKTAEMGKRSVSVFTLSCLHACQAALQVTGVGHGC